MSSGILPIHLVITIVVVIAIVIAISLVFQRRRPREEKAPVPRDESGNTH